MSRQTPAPAPLHIITPTVRRVARRSLFWVGAAGVALVVLVLTVGLIGGASGGPPLSASNPAPAGAMGVAEVLRHQGVTVTPTGSLAASRAAITNPAGTTLFIYDAGKFLTAARLKQAVALADTVVLVDPTFGQLQAVAPGVAQAGLVDGTLSTDCAVSAVRQAGAVSGGGVGYRVRDGNDAISCLGSGDRVYSLVQLTRGSSTLTVLGALDALSNEHVAENGNAALALNLLGAHPSLVWYIPTLADVSTTDVSLADLTPGWVIPVALLLIIVFITAALWRGRRFGPLVIENLPVTVRASETMVGRARLYERSSSRLRALDSLRIGAIGRLAVACGLPRVATVDEVVAAVASLTGTQVRDIRVLLIDDIPTSDRDLVALSDALLSLEQTVARALRP